jgi:predicted DNA-binding protein YlxM (UPF0122 family)
MNMANKNLEIVNFGDKEYMDKIELYHKEGGKPGLELGFKNLSEFYTHKDAGVTDWTGQAAVGKTYFVLELFIQLSEKYNKRHLLYVPDLGTEIEVMAKLVKMYTGKDFETKYNNQITIREVYNNIPRIGKDFLLVRKKDVKTPLTPQELWEFAAEYKDDYGKIDTCLIDSWKNMYHSMEGKREDQYLDYVLAYRNEIAESSNIHIHTIAHATKTELSETTNSNGNRKRRVPSAEDIKGGNSWYANGKNIITIDRGSDNDTSIDIYVWKTKPENVGKKGAILGKIFLDLKKGRYFERLNGHTCYAFEHLEKDTSFEELHSPNASKQQSMREGIKNMESALKTAEMKFPEYNPFAQDESKNNNLTDDKQEDYSTPPF